MNKRLCYFQTCNPLQTRSPDTLIWWVLCQVFFLFGTRFSLLFNFLITGSAPSEVRIQLITWGWLLASTLGFQPGAVHRHGEASLLLSRTLTKNKLLQKWSSEWGQSTMTTLAKNNCLFPSSCCTWQWKLFFYSFTYSYETQLNLPLSFMFRMFAFSFLPCVTVLLSFFF